MTKIEHRNKKPLNELTKTVADAAGKPCIENPTNQYETDNRLCETTKGLYKLLDSICKEQTSSPRLLKINIVE